MILIIENGILHSNLDCRNFALLNLGRVLPPPAPLVSINDPRLSDPRAMIAGSVTNLSVAATAKIAQSKLNLNGNMPLRWLMWPTIPSENEGARGDITERVANKGVPGGYAPLDSTGRIPAANISAGAGVGSVNTVNLIMPDELPVGGTNPITSSGSFAPAWANVPDGSWFGVNGLVASALALEPFFLTGTIPLGLMPSLSATKFTTGVFSITLLPPGAPMGPTSSLGLVRDPGLSGDPHDYLGRDQQWHAFTKSVSLQPAVPGVIITLNSVKGGIYIVIVRSQLAGSVLFYRVNGGPFLQVPIAAAVISSPPPPSISLSLNANDFVEAYAAKAGYNNSPIATYTVTLPAPA
jgi:hypothetical protein